MKKTILFLTAGALVAAAFFGAYTVRSAPAADVQAAQVQKLDEAADTADVRIGTDTVTVSGKYTVYVTPDRAQVNLGVRTNEETAVLSQEKNTEIVNSVIDAIRALGVEEKSIRTTGYNIWQEYDYNSNKVKGYTVSTSLTIKDLEISQAGSVISEAIAAGANQMNGISYSCSTYDEAYEEALASAVSAAHKKAEVLAGAADKTLGDVQSLQEGYQDTSARYKNSNVSMDTVEEAALGSAAVSVMPGESEVEAEVTVTYYLTD